MGAEQIAVDYSLLSVFVPEHKNAEGEKNYRNGIKAAEANALSNKQSHQRKQHYVIDGGCQKPAANRRNAVLFNDLAGKICSDKEAVIAAGAADVGAGYTELIPFLHHAHPGLTLIAVKPNVVIDKLAVHNCFNEALARQAGLYFNSLHR